MEHGETVDQRELRDFVSVAIFIISFSVKVRLHWG